FGGPQQMAVMSAIALRVALPTRHAPAASAWRMPPRVYSPLAARRISRPMAVPAPRSASGGSIASAHRGSPLSSTKRGRCAPLARRLLLAVFAAAARERRERRGEGGEFGRDDPLRRRRRAERLERLEVLERDRTRVGVIRHLVDLVEGEGEALGPQDLRLPLSL